MPTRLEVLEQMVARGVTDAFPMYGLALEYRSAGRADDALRTFATLRARFPAYVPQYLMAGQLCQQLGRAGDAREWFTLGAEAARASRDAHALSELEGALAALGGR
jgi:hypothetical protein